MKKQFQIRALAFCSALAIYSFTEIVSAQEMIWQSEFTSANYPTKTQLIKGSSEYFYAAGLEYPYAGFGENQAFVIKFDELGSIVWKENIPSQIGNGNLVMLGGLENDGEGGAFALLSDFYPAGNSTINVARLVRFNSEGEIIFDQSYGQNEMNFGKFVKRTMDGGLVVGGMSLNSGENNKAWAFKTDNFGNLEWSNVYGAQNSANEEAVGIWPLMAGYLLAVNSTEGAYLLLLDSSGDSMEKIEFPCADCQIIGAEEIPSDGCGLVFLLRQSSTSGGKFCFARYLSKDEIYFNFILEGESGLAIFDINRGSNHGFILSGAQIGSGEGKVISPFMVEVDIWGNTFFACPLSEKNGNVFNQIINDALAIGFGKYVVSSVSFETNGGNHDMIISRYDLNEVLEAKDNQRDREITVYSNLQKSELEVIMPRSLGGKISIFDLQGREIFGRQINEEQASIHIGFLPAGIYLYRLQSGARIISGKFFTQ